MEFGDLIIQAPHTVPITLAEIQLEKLMNKPVVVQGPLLHR